MSEPYTTQRKEILSHCCGASIMEDSDICTKCKEHCQGQCPDCEDGFVDVIDESRLFGREVIDVPYKKDICSTCNGTGEIDL